MEPEGRIMQRRFFFFFFLGLKARLCELVGNSFYQDSTPMLKCWQWAFFRGGGEIKKSPMKIPGLVHDWRYLLSNPMPSSNESSGTGISTGKGKSVTFFSRIGGGNHNRDLVS